MGWEAEMLALAGLVCGFVFGWGLLISGMMQPAKVLAFLDVFGAWDPSLLVVMAAALAVGSVGYAFARPRMPMFAARNLWPDKAMIDAPLVIGAALFGVGWGLSGLCPGPAIENLATLSPRLIVFVIAMALGMAAHDAWQRRRVAAAPSTLAANADG
jgi:uncharacterized membrane protein YedE/YeeE